MIRRNGEQVSLETEADVMGYLAGSVAESIADEGFPGHDLETVIARMTTDKVLDAIRRSVNAGLERGETVLEAMVRTGQVLIARYYDHWGL